MRGPRLRSTKPRKDADGTIVNHARNEPSFQAPPPDPEVETVEPTGADAPAPPPLETTADRQVRLAHSQRRARHARRMRRLRIAMAVLVLCGIAALVSVVWQPQTISQLPLTAQRPQAPETPDTAKPRYPIDSAATALPPLDQSDAAMISVLQGLWSGTGIVPFVEPRNIVRNVVVTVDNLPRRTLPAQKSPVKPLAGSFGTASAGNGLVIGEMNRLRYAPYMRLLESVSVKHLVDAYVRHYALFQQAYRELGYPDGHFNDRLVEAIDSMLATPEIKTPLAVVQPKIFYEFADRELEQLPAGQKLLLRMGPENAAIVKARFREIRRLVANEELDLVQAPSLPPLPGQPPPPGQPLR